MHRGRIKGDSLRHDYVVPPPSKREALTEAPSGRGLPVVGGSRRRRVGENAVRVFRVALPRVILSEAKPEGQIALQFGSREKVKRKSYRKPFVDPDLRSILRISTMRIPVGIRSAQDDR